MLAGSVSIRSFIALTRSVLGSVSDIEPESSMIASMLVAAAQEAACALGAVAPLDGAAIAASANTVAVAESRCLLRFIVGLPPVAVRRPQATTRSGNAPATWTNRTAGAASRR